MALFLCIALTVMAPSLNAQGTTYANSVSEALPFGKVNPNAAQEVRDYAELIGTCDCKSQTRNKDETWPEPIDMQWTFKYIMNGNAVQDETLKSDGKHSGSIRQFNTDSLKWYVHYYSSQNAAPVLAAWEGGRKDNEIILYRPQKAPNGMEGFYKIRFYDISENGFNWLGVWTTKEEDFVYETWKITCKKRRKN
ncbi:MAG: hypothetical protein HKN31_05435 [Pricia sp.]|nr:hypothetical protein [Pricia sp.]